MRVEQTDTEMVVLQTGPELNLIPNWTDDDAGSRPKPSYEGSVLRSAYTDTGRKWGSKREKNSAYMRNNT